MINKKEITFWIAIITPLMAIALTYGVHQATLANHEKRITQIETEIKNINQLYTRIEVRLSEIQKDILYIKESIKE